MSGVPPDCASPQTSQSENRDVGTERSDNSFTGLHFVLDSMFETNQQIVLYHDLQSVMPYEPSWSREKETKRIPVRLYHESMRLHVHGAEKTRLFHAINVM
jgi:hypothetical protein